MTTAAEVIQALQRRLRLTQYRSRPGEFPPGWQAWFDEMRQRRGAVTGATAEAIVATLLQRPLAAPPGRALALSRWQAFSTMWRQEWQPAAREERWLRALAATVSGLVHLVFAVLFLWLGIVQFVVMSAPPRGEETVIQVEYIGTGAPEQVGGGPVPEREVQESAEPRPVAAAPQPSTRPEPSPQPSPRPAVAAPSPELPPLPEAPAPPVPQLRPEQPQIAEREIPEPQPAQQPLVVSKPVPDRSSFVLPPPTLQVPDAETTIPTLQSPDLQVQSVEVPEPLPQIRPVLPQAEIEAPAIRSGVPRVTVREIPGPLPQVELPELSPPTVQTPVLRPELSRIRERAIPAPPTPEPAEAGEESMVAEAPEAAAPAESASPPAPEPARMEPAQAEPDSLVGAGPQPVPAPGGWPAPKVDDSWDLADGDRAGDQAGQPSGLYDSDGSVNLAETPGSASPGLPPGTVTEEIANLDRAGTWLRRPPTDDYEPTVFDQYWRPSETLIAEWVRKSITTVRIPIPGTSKSIVCRTILIAVGGACGIHDPNLNDQPATARPPPDIPFKPELQEGNGSVPPAS